MKAEKDPNCRIVKMLYLYFSRKDDEIFKLKLWIEQIEAYIAVLYQ